jgi:hypothetical protein
VPHLNYLTFDLRQGIEMIMTIIFGICFMGIVYEGVELYYQIQNNVPLVAKVSKTYILVIIIMGCVHIFIRMIFMSVTDLAEI